MEPVRSCARCAFFGIGITSHLKVDLRKSGTFQRPLLYVAARPPPNISALPDCDVTAGGGASLSLVTKLVHSSNASTTRGSSIVAFVGFHGSSTTSPPLAQAQIAHGPHQVSWT